MMTTTTPLQVSGMKVTDRFFAPRAELVRTQMLPYQWDALNDRLTDAEPSHSIENFRIAAGLSQGSYYGMVFQDSDLYKWLEAVAFILQDRPDETLRAQADSAIELIEKTQRTDGYLNTYYQVNCPDRRFTNLQDHHELYCAGHLFEAAAAYDVATGDHRLLNVALRYADLIDRTFGPEPEKLKGYPGHEVIEMGLVKLYRLTGQARYLKLASYFIDQRGQAPLYFEQEAVQDNNRKFYWAKSHMLYQYYQAGKPVREQSVAVGHAVRQLYLLSGMADVAIENGDEELWAACEKLFRDISEKQMYITGAIGSSEIGESFTYDYDLPNDTVYAETCAQIGLCFFAQRMLGKEVDARYADVMERALYNSVISGMSLDAKRFFYVNPLETVPEACDKDDRLRHVKDIRQKWFACSCCPPNLARMLGSLPSYAYATSLDTLFMHLYLGGEIETKLNGLDARFTVESNYPWSGNVKVVAHTHGRYTVAARVPGWCGSFELKLNGQSLTPEVKKGYFYIEREWQTDDVILLSLAMPVTVMRANPAVREDVGRLAVMRGPLVYCLEETDNGTALHRLAIEPSTAFVEQDRPDLLGGVVTLSSTGYRLTDGVFASGALYAPADAPMRYEPVSLTWIPYYAWTNRERGEMRVWVWEK